MLSPVKKLVFEQFAADTLALPMSEVRILNGDLGERRRSPCRQRAVEVGELVNEDPS